MGEWVGGCVGAWGCVGGWVGRRVGVGWVGGWEREWMSCWVGGWVGGCVGGLGPNGNLRHNRKSLSLALHPERIRRPPQIIRDPQSRFDRNLMAPGLVSNSSNKDRLCVPQNSFKSKSE